MSTKLPRLSAGRVSVLQTDPRTGVPLTKDGGWASGEELPAEQFASLEAAEVACRARVHERPDTEWWLHDHDGNPIKSIRDDVYWQAWVAEATVRRDRSFWHRLLDRLRGR
jgi:hypothetical protein